LALGWVGLAGAADKKKPAGKPLTKEKLAAGQPFRAKVKAVEGSTKNFTVEVTYAAIDPDKVRAHAEYDLKRKAEMSLVTDLNERRKQLLWHAVEMRKRQLDIYKTVTQQVKLQGTEDVKVRRRRLPVERDDNGKIRKYTRAEIKELKGPDKRLPGFTAEFESLRPDQVVTVYPAKAKKKPVKKEKDQDLGEQRFPVVMIVIEHEPDTGK
jgi:hypothetical protein